MSNRESYGFALTSERRCREQEGMPLPVLASSSTTSLGHILQWPGFPSKNSWAKSDRQR